MQPTEPLEAPNCLGSDDEIVAYLNGWMEDGSPSEIARALGDVARTRGLTEIAGAAGGAPQALHAALSVDANPTLEMLVTVLDTLGLELTVRTKAA